MRGKENVVMTRNDAFANDLLAEKTMSGETLAQLGRGRLAYYKPIVSDGVQAWAVYAADGEPLALVESLAGAILLLRSNDLEATALH
jgi:hypothetical protein